MSRDTFDIAAIRKQFPIFDQPLPSGRPVTFLDSAASAQKPQCVIDAEQTVQATHYANAYRGVYQFGAQIDDELEASRVTVQQLLHAQHSHEIIFTAGSTISINMIAQGWGRRHLQPGDEILLSVMEHHANLVPWQQVAQATGAQLVFIPLTAAGELDLAAFENLVTARTRILAVAGMSNMLGTINPIRQLSERIHAVGGIVVVDGAQSVPHLPVNVVDDGIDFLAFSGHKIYGPTGVGVLYGRADFLEQTDPLIFGGHMIDRVTLTQSTWAAAPAKFEAGTLPIVQAVAFKAAIDFVTSIGFDTMHEHESTLLNAVYDRLSEIPGTTIFGPPADRRGAIISFTMQGAHPEDLAQLLDRKGVFVRHGHHCTMPLHEQLGVPATVRVSFGIYNTLDDVDRLIDAIHFARGRLRLESRQPASQ